MHFSKPGGPPVGSAIYKFDTDFQPMQKPPQKKSLNTSKVPFGSYGKNSNNKKVLPPRPQKIKREVTVVD